MKKALVKFSHIEHVPVCCQTCRKYSEIDRKCHSSRELCRDNDFALWEFEDTGAEVVEIWDEKDEVKS